MGGPAVSSLQVMLTTVRQRGQVQHQDAVVGVERAQHRGQAGDRRDVELAAAQQVAEQNVVVLAARRGQRGR